MVLTIAMPTKRQRIYPEKPCLACNKLFRQQGKYCCRACGNTRTFTTNYRAKISLGMRRKMSADPEFRAAAVARIQPDIPIPPQIESPMGLNQFLQDGDLWTNAE